MRIILATVVAAVLAGGCSSSSPGGHSGPVDVVAAFYPLAEAATVVGGSDVHVTNLTPPGAEPHDLEPTTRQVDQIQQADVIIDMGRGFQPGVETAARRRVGKATVVTILDVLRLPAGEVGSEDQPGQG